MKEWINPKTIVGPPAEDAKYLRRPAINEIFWLAIAKGEHVRFTAPRRVGKSSVMKDLEKNPAENTLVIYNNIESDKTSQDFYKRLWTLLVTQMGTKKELTKRFVKWFGSRNIGEISLDGKFKITEAKVDYKAELLDLIADLGNQEYQMVLLLDEFPDVIVSINKNESAAHAAEVLHTLRSIRHDKRFTKFSLVLAGSIGLEHVIATIDRTKLINDLKPINIPALTEAEGHELLNLQLDGATMQLAAAERTYLLTMIGHLMPYYIQLMIVQCNDIARSTNKPVITIAVINQAFTAVVTNNENFSDWENRLRDYLIEKDYEYCIGLLTRCAHQDYTLQQAYNYSKKVTPVTGYRGLIDDVLVKDGYLVSDGITLKFLSPFLEAWWQNRHPKFEIED